MGHGGERCFSGVFSSPLFFARESRSLTEGISNGREEVGGGGFVPRFFAPALP